MTLMWQDIIKMVSTCITEVPCNSAAKIVHGWGTSLPDSDSCLPLPLIHLHCAPLLTWSNLSTNLSSKHSGQSGGTGLPLLISAYGWPSLVLQTRTQFKSKLSTDIGRPLQQDCIWYVTSPRRSLLGKCHTVSQYTSKCNLIHAHNKSTAFHAPIFTKLTDFQKHYVQIYYTEFLHSVLESQEVSLLPRYT